MEKLVLTVDDEPGIRLLFTKVLGMAGFRVEAVSNGEECLERINGGLKPDLIIVDLKMPKMSGVEVIEHLRSRDEMKKVPIVVVSGSSELSHFPDMKKVQGYLIKPFDIFDLVETVKTQLAG